jgi:hypothetical protein
VLNNLDASTLERDIMVNDRNPIILAALYETRLLLDPQPATAACLLRIQAHPRFIHTFLTPHWTYRAGMILVEGTYSLGASFVDHMEAISTCMVILDRASLRWKGAAALRDSFRFHLSAKEPTANTNMMAIG